MKKDELICIGCPMGCMLTVETMEDGTMQVSGNTCMRGEIYAKKELINPTRILTSTVRVENGIHPVVSVKTAADIPKGKISECMEAIKKITVKAPVSIGDIVLRDVASTGVDVIATKNIEIGG